MPTKARRRDHEPWQGCGLQPYRVSIMAALKAMPLANPAPQPSMEPSARQMAVLVMIAALSFIVILPDLRQTVQCQLRALPVA
jgi:hypothetical protein